MSRHQQRPPPPEPFERPDIGFVAASGVYVAIVLLMGFITVALASGATAATILGGVTSTITGGLIVGSLLASRFEGVPERLGQRWRSLAVLFTIPCLFALLSLVSFVSSISLATATAAGIGSVLTGGVAAGIASMARTRYARAMTPGEPILTIRRLNPNQGRWATVLGLLSISGAGLSALSESGFAVMLLLVGAWSLFLGISTRTQGRRFAKDEQSEGETSRQRGRKVFGTTYSFDPTGGMKYLPELHIHENGIVTKQGERKRFIPWNFVRDVRLTPEELLIERHRGLDIRCDRAVIEDAEKVYEEVERVRGKMEAHAENDTEPTPSKDDIGREHVETEIE